jgi:hypothetical protein
MAVEGPFSYSEGATSEGGPRGFQGISVHADRAVALAFVDTLTKEFLYSDHISVDTGRICMRVANAAGARPDFVAPQVVSLISDLTMTQSRVFTSDDQGLLLTRHALGRPSLVAGALRAFWEHLQTGAEPSSALTEFFDGFEREIMHSRVHGEETPGRG